MNLFKREVKEIHHYHTVELPANSKLPELTGDLRESLKTLFLYPAFQYLLQRLRFQKAAMETALREGINLTETQLRYLQAGIFWAGQIEKDISVLTQASANIRPVQEDERAEFDKVRQNLDMVGLN